MKILTRQVPSLLKIHRSLPAAYSLAVLLFLALLASSSLSFAAEKKAYPTPDITKGKLVFQETQLVADVKPPTAVDIKTYKNPDGTMFRVYSVKNVIFRYDVDTNGESPYEYRLLDKDGDGIFETREELVGELPGTEGGQKYYIDLGREPGKEFKYSYEDVKRPGMSEQKQLLMGYPIYIPPWVLLRFNNP